MTFQKPIIDHPNNCNLFFYNRNLAVLLLESQHCTDGETFDYSFFIPFPLAPFDIVGHTNSFGFGNSCHEGKQKLTISRASMQIFLLEENIHTQTSQLSGKHQCINGVSSKTGYTLGNNGVDLPGTAILDHTKKICAVSGTCAGCSSVGIDIDQLGVVVLGYQIGVVADLGNKAVILLFSLCRNTAVCGNALFKWTGLRLFLRKYYRQVSFFV